MKVPFDAYRIFYFVAKYQSFTRAAKMLLNSQPNVTRAIARLEDDLGCRLFIRSNKGVTLTAEGAQLFEHVQVAYDHLQRGENEIREGQRLLHGHLSIGASESALHGLLLPVLNSFHQAYPGIRLQLSTGTSPQAIDAVRHGLVELALVTTPAEVRPPLRRQQLMSFRDVLIAGVSFAEEKEQVFTLGNAAGHPMVSLAQHSATHQLYSRLFSEQHLNWSPEIEVATTAQVLSVVKQDLGIGFVPDFMAQEALAHGEVIQLTLAETLPEREILLVDDSSRPQSTAVQALIRLLEQSGAPSPRHE